MKLSRLLPIALTLATLALTLASAQAQSSIPQTPIADLPSDRRIDYYPLQNLLKAGEWEAANAMTSNLMLRVAGQHERGFLVADDIRDFPCKDLLTVNRLWQYYSFDRFGYSTQSHLWVTMKGKNYQDSLKFEKKVGWSTVKPQPSNSLDNPLEKTPLASTQFPIGYFPFRPASNGGQPDAWGGGWIGAMPQRLNLCMNPSIGKPPIAKPTNPKTQLKPNQPQKPGSKPPSKPQPKSQPKS